MLTPEQENVLMGYMGMVLFIGFVMLVAAFWKGGREEDDDGSR